MMKGILTGILIAAFSLGVCAQKKKELTTTVDVSYCLPKVAYQLEVTMECTRYIPGPYWKYAEKELSLTPKIVEAGERWKITDIAVKPQYLPDEKAVYGVSASLDYTPVSVTLSAEGFLAGVCAGEGGTVGDYGTAAVYRNEEEREVEMIDIMKLNTYNHLKEVLDTNYTFQEIDGEMKKIWDPIIRYARKTEADNVKEAVSEIFRIRSERVKLLNAENGVPDGKSLEIILKEYDRMEANYLSLFMGRKETRQVKRVVSCVPLEEGEPVVAFRFSETSGMTDTKNVSAQAYALQVVDAIVPASRAQEAGGGAASVSYRVPAQGELQLLCGKNVILRMETIVPQFGVVKHFPLEVISNEGLSLEFYPSYGSLKSIKKR